MRCARWLIVAVSLGLTACLDLDDNHYRFHEPEAPGARGDGGGGQNTDGSVHLADGGTPVGGTKDGGVGFEEGDASVLGDGGSAHQPDSGGPADAGSEHDDGGQPQLPEGGCLAITPNPIDLGTVKTGCSSAARTFTLYDICGPEHSVTLKSISMLETGEFDFTQLPTLPPGGLVMAGSGASVSFQVAYSPVNLGTDLGHVAVLTREDGRLLTYVVVMRATGDASGLQTDRFVQDARAKADVLLVVDDSCSMEDKQETLAGNFSAFMTNAQSAHVDFHLGVTSTTMSTDGGMVCLPVVGCQVDQASLAPDGLLFRDPDAGIVPVLTASTPNPAAVFSTMVHLGIEGSAIEMGLAAATAALTEPKRSRENQDFLRSDANLVVIVVSDASDQSPLAASTYSDLLLNVKGANNRSMFTFSNIGPYLAQAPGDCTYDDSHDPARYEAMVDATSGVKAEICSADWATPLTALGQSAFGLRRSFFLNAVPNLSNAGSLSVKINDAAVATSLTCPGSSNSVACFESLTNSIQFKTAPRGGDVIAVTYSTGCF